MELRIRTSLAGFNKRKRLLLPTDVKAENLPKKSFLYLTVTERSMCCPTNPEHNELEELRSLLESSAVLEDFDEEPEEGNHDQTDGHVCEECEGCHATNGYLLDCLNHVLSKIKY